MHHKENMLSGKLYKGSDAELVVERQRAKSLVHQFNTQDPMSVGPNDPTLSQLLGSRGAFFYIEPPFRCDYGYNIHLGNNFYANYNCVILDCAPVTIGANVLFGPNVSLFTAGHPIGPNLRRDDWEYAFPITLGDTVWIGGGSIINPGVSIGSTTVIGSGSVVTRDIPAGVIAAGNPCRVIRTLTAEDEVRYFKNCRIQQGELSS